MHIVMRGSSRVLNEYLSLLSKLKCTSLTVHLYVCVRVTIYISCYFSVLYFVPRWRNTDATKVDITLALIKIIA